MVKFWQGICVAFSYFFGTLRLYWMVFYRFWPILIMDQPRIAICRMWRIWTKSLLWNAGGGGGPGSEVWHKMVLYPPKSCREGAGSVIASKYVYVAGSPCVTSIDLVIISIVRAPGSWKSASKLVKTDQNSWFWANHQLWGLPQPIYATSNRSR